MTEDEDTTTSLTDEPDDAHEPDDDALEAAEAAESTEAPPPAPPGALRAAVMIGDDGEGQAMIGIDIDRATLWNPPEDCSVGLTPAHTIGISRVLVSGAKPGSVVHVVVLPK